MIFSTSDDPYFEKNVVRICLEGIHGLLLEPVQLYSQACLFCLFTI